MNRYLVGLFVLTSCKALSNGGSVTELRNADQWVFDDEPLTAKKPGGGKRSFKWTDDIYARVFYDEELADIFDKQYEFPFEVGFALVDNENIHNSAPFGIAKSEWSREYLDVEILPSADHVKHAYEYKRTLIDSFMMDKYGDNPPELTGKQDVFFLVRGKGAEGDKYERSAIITIDFTGRTDKKVAKRAAAVNKAAERALAGEIELPTAGELQNDAAFVKHVAARARKEFDEVDELRVIVPNDEWQIERNGGVIENRSTIVYVLIQREDECRIYTRSLIQEYTGPGFQQPGRFAATTSSSRVVTCERAFGED